MQMGEQMRRVGLGMVGMVSQLLLWWVEILARGGHATKLRNAECSLPLMVNLELIARNLGHLCASMQRCSSTCPQGLASQILFATASAWSARRPCAMQCHIGPAHDLTCLQADSLQLQLQAPLSADSWVL